MESDRRKILRVAVALDLLHVRTELAVIVAVVFYIVGAVFNIGTASVNIVVAG